MFSYKDKTLLLQLQNSNLLGNFSFIKSIDLLGQYISKPVTCIVFEDNNQPIQLCPALNPIYNKEVALVLSNISFNMTI